MPGNAVLLFKQQQTFASERGEVVVFMKLHELSEPDPSQGIFLDRYIMSWTAFLAEDPDDRILVDCHEPFGIHVHVNDQPRLSFEARSISEARSFFFEAVQSHFGIGINT